MHTQTLAELARRLADGSLSSVELTSHFLDRIAAHNDTLNAYITVDSDGALKQAAAADERRRQGEAGVLTGIPIAHKDIFCTHGIRTSCGSRMLEDFVSPYDATVVSKLARAGVVTLGKTNMDEFAMGSSNENSHFGAVKNPWDLTRSPGGSSGGSACAVAAGLATAATGTDTGGSIRLPAAFTGLTGIKPTYGRVSRYGMVAFASSLDQGGVLARTAEDAALVLTAMSGFDSRDSTSVDRPVPDYAAGLDGGFDRLRIGVPEEYFDDALEASIATCVRSALDALRALGADIVPVRLPHAHLSVPAYYIVAPAEASSNLSRFDGVRYGHRCDDPQDLTDLYVRSRGEGFGAEVKRRILTGTYVLSAGYYDAFYLKAQKVRQLISADFADAFSDVDLLVGPTSPTVAFALGAKVSDPVAMYLSDVYTTGASLAGLPGLSLPCGLADGLPVGLQMLAPHFEEQRLLSAAHAYQQESDWHLRVAEIAP